MSFFIRKLSLCLSLNYLTCRIWAWDFLKIFLTFTDANWLKLAILSLLIFSGYPFTTALSMSIIEAVHARKKLLWTCQFARALCLHEGLLLRKCDPRFTYLKYRFSSCWRMLNVSLRIKQGKGKLWKQNLIVTSGAVTTMKVIFGSGIARLTVMLARVIFHLCWGFSTCMDTCTCYRTCLRAWAV